MVCYLSFVPVTFYNGANVRLAMAIELNDCLVEVVLIQSAQLPEKRKENSKPGNSQGKSVNFVKA